jgi:hypothetical protein
MFHRREQEAAELSALAPHIRQPAFADKPREKFLL